MVNLQQIRHLPKKISYFKEIKSRCNKTIYTLFSFFSFFHIFRVFLDNFVFKNLMPDWKQLPTRYSSEVVTRRCSVKMVLLNISQNSQQNTCVIVFFFFSKKLQAQACKFNNKRLWLWYFPVNFAKFFRTSFL